MSAILNILIHVITRDKTCSLNDIIEDANADQLCDNLAPCQRYCFSVVDRIPQFLEISYGSLRCPSNIKRFFSAVENENFSGTFLIFLIFFLKILIAGTR